jgi:hypothetical protein
LAWVWRVSVIGIETGSLGFDIKYYYNDRLKKIYIYAVLMGELTEVINSNLYRLFEDFA